MSEENTFAGRSLRTFISYTENDKELAGSIKETLKKFGIESFLAHDDIAPGKDWKDELIRNIKTCDIFIPLLGKDFRESDWTDQECGMAYYDTKAIIPIRIGIAPYGFIGKYQAMKFNIKDVEESCLEIVKIIKNEHKHLEEQLKDSLIRGLLNSRHFTDSNATVSLLENFKFSSEQMNGIVNGAIENTQIHWENRCKKVLKSWLNEYKGHIPKEKSDEMKELLQ